MIFTIYDPPDSSNSKTWGELCVGAIVDVASWEYEGQFCGVGTFELVVPVGAEGVDKLKLDRFLMCGDGGFIIKQLEFGADEVQVSGYDLNGLLLNRLTVAKTDDGKDKQSGSTEAIVKHYVAANCVSSDDTGRNFPGFVVAVNQDRGISNDAASPRLECVADVISDILSAQQMGWKISAVGMSTGYTGKEKFSFDVISAVDRTWGQTTRDPVTFSYGLGTVNSMKSEQSSADAKNTLYCELADGTVQTYSPILTAGSSGYSRTEDYTSLNCELSEMSVYAEHEIADRYAAVNNVTIEHIDPSQFGAKFHLGDIVTVYDSHIGINSNNHTLEALITAVKVKRTNGDCDVSVTIGGTRPKLIDRVSKSVGAVSNKAKETTAQISTKLPEQEKHIVELETRVVELENNGGSGTASKRDRIIASNGNAWVAQPAQRGTETQFSGGGLWCYDASNDVLGLYDVYKKFLSGYSDEYIRRVDSEITCQVVSGLTLKASLKWASRTSADLYFYIEDADALSCIQISSSKDGAEIMCKNHEPSNDYNTRTQVLKIDPEGKATITVGYSQFFEGTDTTKSYEILTKPI